MRVCGCCGDEITRKNTYGYCSRTPECRSRYQQAYQDVRRPPTIRAGEPCKGCGIPTTSKYGYCKRASCLDLREQVRHQETYTAEVGFRKHKPEQERRRCMGGCGGYLPLNVRPFIALCRNCDGTRAVQRTKLRKTEVMLAYGGACACCGEDNIDFLTLDHVNGDGKADREARKMDGGGASFYAWLKARNFPDKDRYQVLCANCNGAKGTKTACPCRTSRVSVFSVEIPGQFPLF